MHDLVIRNARIVDGTGRDAFAGDVAIDGTAISTVGGRAGPAHREIDASDLVVAPGWVDIHTHYDGQVTWDPYVTPSSWHGVTTVVMGNCGVGFAPVRPDQHDLLIEIMDGVEDIPGSALAEGMQWAWESFPEYLDALARTPRVLDVGTQVPHCAVRTYVMGAEGAYRDEATPEEIEAMAEVVRDGLRAGALGFTTSRTIFHRDLKGELVPGTHATPEELLGIGRVLGEVGHGVFELVSDHWGREPDFSWMKQFCRDTGRPLTFALLQMDADPDSWRIVVADALAASREEGLEIRPQVPGRPTGLLMSFLTSLHPFISHPTFQKLRDLPRVELLRELRRPHVRDAILSEAPQVEVPRVLEIITGFAKHFPLKEAPDYEPTREQSVAERAVREGRNPREVAYDLMLEDEGENYLYHPLGNYCGYDLDELREMLVHPSTVLGLSDGGAHCGLVADAGMPTYMLTHWARDRSRGEQIPLEQVVKLQTHDTACLYGLWDRGTIEPGMKADLNLIDLEALRLDPPRMAYDLPLEGRRVLQMPEGYRATVCSGTVTYESGEATEELPGALIRGPQAGPSQ